MTSRTAPRSVILLAGPSGSGKSHLVRSTGAQHLRLDDFYHADDHPDLPRIDGLIDWDDVRTWDIAAAADALEALLRDGSTTVPRYSIAENRPVGSHEVRLAAGEVLVAEGIFAPDLLTACRRRGLAVTPVWLERGRTGNFARRLRRDLRQHRKPPMVLVTRGLRLARTEPALRSSVLAHGFRALSMRQATALVRSLQG